MKVFLLTVLLAFAAAAPLEDANDAVEVIVNGVAEGEPLEIADIVDVKLKEHVEGHVASSVNLLHPFSAVGLAEAAAAAAEPVAVHPIGVIDLGESALPDPAVLPQPIVPEPVVLPEPVSPEYVPSPVILPAPVLPEVVPEPIVMPEPVMPEVVPAPIVIPEPVAPEVVPEPIIILPQPVFPGIVNPVIRPPFQPEVVMPEPVPEVPQIPTGEIYNDGNVQVQVNAPSDEGVIATLQSWFSMVLTYFNQGVQTTQQIV